MAEVFMNETKNLEQFIIFFGIFNLCVWGENASFHILLAVIQPDKYIEGFLYIAPQNGLYNQCDRFNTVSVCMLIFPKQKLADVLIRYLMHPNVTF